MILTYGQEIQRIAERTYDNRTDINQKNKQRRNSVVDMYGVPHEAYGDANTPATVYISVSTEMIQYSRLEFKLWVKPFRTTITGGTSATTVSISDTSLSTENASGQGSHNHGITPNPHDHESTPHSHNLISGVTLINTTSSNFRIVIEGIDVTPYLMAQHGGRWIDGEGIYPTAELGDKDDVYDLLDVAGLLKESDYESYTKLIKQGFKRVEVYSDAPFGMTLYEYKKYNYTGR